MRNGFVTALLLAVGLNFAVSAQQAGENINVLPVVPGDPLKGDLYLQRQVEPTIVMSTRNPNHLAAFYIDYRTVYISNDLNAGAEGPQLAAGLFSTFKGFLARLVRKE